MNKVVLITGSSSGIGKSIAIEYAKHGYNVVITYCCNENKALELDSYIKQNYKVASFVVKLDIQNENNIQECVEEVIKKFGTIDILINNAGIAIDTMYEDKIKDNFMKTLEINTVGTFLMCKYVAKYMMSKKCGNIVNISSTNGIDTNYIESLDYDASKAAVISLTKNLSKQYAPYVRVNTVCPGWIDTPMNKGLSDDFKKEEISKIFLKRFGQPEEIAKVVYFLTSDDASYINNSVIRVDGGY